MTGRSFAKNEVSYDGRKPVDMCMRAKQNKKDNHEKHAHEACLNGNAREAHTIKSEELVSRDVEPTCFEECREFRETDVPSIRLDENQRRATTTTTTATLSV